MHLSLDCYTCQVEGIRGYKGSVLEMIFLNVKTLFLILPFNRSVFNSLCIQFKCILVKSSSSLFNFRIADSNIFLSVLNVD